MTKKISNENFGVTSIPPMEDPKRPEELAFPERLNYFNDKKNRTVVVDGTLCSDNFELLDGILHGGEELDPGTLHGGEELDKGTLHGGEELDKGTLHQSEKEGGCPLLPFTLQATYSPASYRTKDGKGTFKFQYVDRGGYFDIDILEEPIQSKTKSDLVCHRLPSRTVGRKKICFSSGKSPKTISAARNFSMQWAELIQKYLTTGKKPDDQLSEKGNSSKGFWNWSN